MAYTCENRRCWIYIYIYLYIYIYITLPQVVYRKLVGGIVYTCFWQLPVASGCFWLLLAAPECFWLLLAASGCSWLLLAAYGCLWTIIGQLWNSYRTMSGTIMEQYVLCGALERSVIEKAQILIYFFMSAYTTVEKPYCSIVVPYIVP